MAGLTRLVRLASDPTCWVRAPLLAELRQLEDRFGLSPHARRQLRWQVEDTPSRSGDLEVVSLADRRGPDPRRTILDGRDPRDVLKADLS